MTNFSDSKLSRIGMPLALFVALILAWYYAVIIFEVPSYVLPSPREVLDSIWFLYSEGIIWPHVIYTFTSMMAGFAIALVAALIAGSLVSEFPILDRTIYPFIVAFQSMPKVALAPILLIWFGFGIQSKIVLVALICFFPIFVNVSVGLRQANPDLISLYRAFSASRMHIFLNVKMPSALGSIFAGLQVALVLSLLAAVTAEFVGSNRGLGYLIQASAINFDVARMFASIVTLQMIGLILSTGIRFAHGRVVFWEGTGSAVRTARTSTTAED